MTLQQQAIFTANALRNLSKEIREYAATRKGSPMGIVVRMWRSALESHASDLEAAARSEATVHPEGSNNSCE